MNTDPDQKFFIWDAESVGLHGQGFAVGGGVYDIHGKAIREFQWDCLPSRANGIARDLILDERGSAAKVQEAGDKQWVHENVKIDPNSINVATPELVRRGFWHEWETAKAEFPGILMAVECGWPVEARFLIECIQDDPATRNWRGPYPMHEIATLMLAAGMDPMATYDRTPEESPAHEPLADARLSARLLSEALSRLNTAHEVCFGEGQGPEVRLFRK